ncbi:MAG: hypothetical protein ACLP5H_25710 [Desulfomonilaceae bacterium]
MTQTQLKRLLKLRLGGRLLLLVFLGAVLFPSEAACETLGIKDPKGNFVPKVTVTVGPKEVEIKKTNPQDSFSSISLTLNPKYHRLIQNVTHLDIQWVDATNHPGKALPFTGPLYNPSTRVFRAPMTKSLSLKLLDKTKVNLFAGKSVADLFALSVGDQPLITSEAVSEKERTVQLGTGRDISINVDKTTIVFNENNFKKGEILNVDNRSGSDQVLGVELPEKGLLYYQIIRKPEQTKIPRENWDRFTLASDSGIFIVLIPEADPAQLSELDGKEIVIKVFQGNVIRETRKIPIRTSSDLKASGKDSGERVEPVQPEEPGQPSKPEVGPSRAAEPVEASAPPARRESTSPAETAQTNRQWGGLWLWIVQIFNLVLLVGLAVYAIFFMLPKIQVLEDRLAKNEMFIHGSREAIREELDQIKAEILRQCQKDPAQE